MTARKVFVTQATGQTGVNTIRLLSEKASNIEVYAGVNKAARMAATHEDMLKHMANVKTFQVDSSDQKAIAERLTDVEELFIIPSSTEEKVQNAKNYIDAAKKANVKFILLLSVLHPKSEGYSWGAQFYEIERYLQESGIPWTILRSNFYSQYLCLFKNQVAKGILPLPIGDGQFCPVDVADVANFARHILQDPTHYRYTTFDLTGASPLNGLEIANILSQVLGHPVHYEDTSIEECKRILAQQNIPEQEIEGFCQFFNLTKENSQFNMPSTFYYKNIMKKDARTLETTVRLSKNAWLSQDSCC